MCVMQNATLISAFAFAALSMCAGAEVVRPRPPLPPVPPVFRPAVVKADEKPVIVESARVVAGDNGLVRRVETMITFTNPNPRTFEGELEFPLPAGATVCGYALEVNGEMVPGVVCEKESARTAFENERKKGIDPGVVEHVKGNVWKTRIYPLLPNAPRKARVDYVEPNEAAASGACVVERDGDDVFAATVAEVSAESRADRLRRAVKARIWWDASMSRHGKSAADRNLLECLPEKGDFTLVVFRNVVEDPLAFSSRADLLKAVDGLVYDGGTCLEEAMRRMSSAGQDFLFTDEIDVEAAGRRRVRVRKLAPGEKPPAEPVEGKLLATQWAADFIADHAADAEARKAEFLELGRRYGVASSVTSLIVLETLEQYLTYRIEPPKCMSFHGEWARRRAAEDDPIAAAKAKADHMQRLLGYWEERVKWWNDPIPPKQTPKSGLFDGVVEGARSMLGVERRATAQASVRRRDVMRAEAGAADFAVAAESTAVRSAAAEPNSAARVKSAAPNAQDRQPAPSATIKIAAWDPKTPYLKAIGEAKDAYGEYLRQRDVYGNSPAFYLDCAGWFFKAKMDVLAKRVISNLSEMKLEDAGLWRTMGWRLREAGAYDEAIAAFRHVLKLRGEEAQSRRDLALVLTEAGKERRDEAMLSEAMALLGTAAFEPAARRSGRRGNDMQTCVVALEELNGLVTWCKANGVKAKVPEMDDAYRREMPLQLRIMMSWDVDETDVDLHVLEPDGEEAYYGHRRTSTGGFVSEDVTTGYGPEEYLRKTAGVGVYRILANYFASHRQALTGAATVTATVYTGWGTKDEKRAVFSFRLDKPKDKHPIGEVKIGD